MARSRWSIQGSLLLLSLAFAACGNTGTEPDPADSAPPAERRPNVLLISLDTLRADRMSSYGYERQTSPFLDSLAETGVRFENAFVNTHGTPPSHASMFTGLYQESHRVSANVGQGKKKRNDRVPESLLLLPEVMEREGYVTIGVTGGGYVSSHFGFEQGFQIFHDRPIGVEPASQLFVDEVRARAGGDEPIFGFFHTYEIHSPYEPPESFKAKFGEYDSDFVPSNENLVPLQESARPTLGDEDIAYLNALYDAGILYTDGILRKLWDELESAGFFDRPYLVVITSDHGEEFAEHGGLLHRVTLYEELIKIPLIIVGSGVPEGRVSKSLVSTVDIAPTIYTVLRVRPGAPVAGRDLLRGLDDPNSAIDGQGNEIVFSQYANLLYSARTKRWKLIADEKGPTELFDLLSDPGEQQNVLERRPKLAKDLWQELEAWRKSCIRLDLEQTDVPIPDESLEQLRALGYVQ